MDETYIKSNLFLGSDAFNQAKNKMKQLNKKCLIGKLFRYRQILYLKNKDISTHFKKKIKIHSLFELNYQIIENGY
jgi:hypothetical protein